MATVVSALRRNQNNGEIKKLGDEVNKERTGRTQKSWLTGANMAGNPGPLVRHGGTSMEVVCGARTC